MFCPKCGAQNPVEGKYCRSCGTDLGNISKALSAPQQPQQLLNHKGKPVHWEGAITKFFSGLAFLIIAIVLAFSNMGRGWWFWMLIPAFGGMAKGIAQFMQLRRVEKGQLGYQDSGTFIGSSPNAALPPGQTEWVAPENKYKTGDLVPPSVTENTTRHLEIEDEAKTMALPKE